MIWYWNSSALLLLDVDSIVWIVRKTIIRMVLTIAIRTARNWVLPYVQFVIELFSLSSSESSSVYFVQVFFFKPIHINALSSVKTFGYLLFCMSSIWISHGCMCLPSKCHYEFYTSEPLNFPSVTLRMLAWNLLKTMYMVSNCYNILIYVSFVCCIVLRLAVELFVLLLQRRRSGPDSVGGASFRSRHESEGEGAWGQVFKIVEQLKALWVFNFVNNSGEGHPSGCFAPVFGCRRCCRQ